eukprot:GSMAST32.ASY1.ANO1.2072.1 assembled CDS
MKQENIVSKQENIVSKQENIVSKQEKTLSKQENIVSKQENIVSYNFDEVYEHFRVIHTRARHKAQISYVCFIFFPFQFFFVRNVVPNSFFLKYFSKIHVLGTQEILRLAVTNGLFETRVKPVFYVSTNGIFPYEDSTPSDYHFFDNGNLREDVDGYAISKFIAENLTKQARSRGLPVTIVRPGNMAGCSKTGSWNETDFVYNLLCGCLLLGVVPSGNEVKKWFFDLTPVNFAAASIISLIKYPQNSLGRVFHIQSPHPHVAATKVFTCMTNSKATSMNEVSLDTFKTILQKSAMNEFEQVGESNVIQRLFAGFDSFIYYLKSPPILDSTQLHREVDGKISPCTKLDENLLKLYMQNS